MNALDKEKVIENNIGKLVVYKNISKADLVKILGVKPRLGIEKYYNNVCNYFNITRELLCSEELRFDYITKKYFLD